jgi:hypothetical protein
MEGLIKSPTFEIKIRLHESIRAGAKLTLDSHPGVFVVLDITHQLISTPHDRSRTHEVRTIVNVKQIDTTPRRE